MMRNTPIKPHIYIILTLFALTSLTVSARAGDVEIDLNSADGSTDFELRDSGGNIQFDVDSDGNTSWPQGADDSDLTVPTYAGNPDTVITAPEGSVAYDSSGNTLYVNTDGATNWEALADGGGGGSAVVAGSNAQIQYNDAGSFGADTGFAYNAATDTLTAVNATFAAINNATIGGTTPANATFSALAVDTNVLYVDPNTNNVGIGTTAPDKPLDVVGDMTASGVIRAEGGNAVMATAGFYSSYGGTLNYGNTANSSVAIKTNNVARLQINAAGNVGIGAIAPEKLLHVAGTLTATDATFETINNAQIGNSAARDATFTDITVTGSINGVVGSSSAGDGTFTTVNVTTGNVGIGTATPVAGLHIRQAVSWLQVESTNAAAHTGMYFNNSGDGSSWYTYRHNAGTYYLADLAGAGTPELVVDVSGNVGIGAPTPGGLLEVSAGTAGDAALIIQADTDNNDENDNPVLKLVQDGGAVTGFVGFIDNSGLLGDGTDVSGYKLNAMIVGPSDGSDVALQFITGDDSDNASVDMTIDNGNVGIGVTDPDTKLEVAGGMSAVDATFSGRLGIGTTTPGVHLQIEATSSAGVFTIADGGVSSFEIEQGSQDNTNLTMYHSATPTIHLAGWGSSYFGDGVYWRDGATDSGDILVRVYSATDDGIIDVYQNDSVVNRINGNGDSYITGGNIGVGTTTPTQKLHVKNVAQLDPTDAPGTCNAAAEGSIYYDASVNEVCFCDGASWGQIDGGGGC